MVVAFTPHRGRCGRCFFFNDTATTEIYTLSLHDALPIFAFSSENMKRSSEEVGLLFKLFLTVLKQETKKLNNNNICLKIIGDMSVFTPEIQSLADDAEQLLSHNTGLNLVIAAN